MIDAQLARFKRTGSYTIFDDKSTRAATPDTGALYALVGQSKSRTAPVNTMVEVADTIELHNTFGKRDKAQERKGNYFILHAEMLLSQGNPIYMLNLRTYDNSHMSAYAPLSVRDDVRNPLPRTEPFGSMFTKTNFWKLKKTKIRDDATLLSVGSISGQNITIYFKSSKNTEFGDLTISGYLARFPDIDITHIPGRTKVEDLFVDMYVFGRDLTNESSVTSPDLLAILDSNGNVDKEKLDDLSLIPESKFIRKYTGSLIPEILNSNGNSLFLETIVNANTGADGIFIDINEDKVYEYADWDVDDGSQPNAIALKDLNIEVVGDDITIPEINMLGYALPAVLSTEAANVLTVSMFRSADDIKVGYGFADGSDAGDINALPVACGLVKFTAGIGYNGDTKDLRAIYTVQNNFLGKDARVVSTDGGTARVVAHQYAGMYTEPAVLQTRDVVVDHRTGLAFPKNGAGEWIYPDDWYTNTGLAGTPVKFATAGEAAASSEVTEGVAQFKPSGPGDAYEDIPGVQVNSHIIERLKNDYATKVKIWKSTLDKNVKFTEAGEDGLILDHENLDFTAKIHQGDFYVIRGAEDRALTLAPIALPGVALTDSQFCDGTPGRQKEILDLLATEGISAGMRDFEKYPFWFLLDSFKTYIEGSVKSQLTTLAECSKKFAYIGGYPYFADFENSKDPIFKDAPDGDLDARHIVAGGNTALPYSKLFSFPGTSAGDYFGLFVGPELYYSDGITTAAIPASAAVALLYGANFLTGGRQPYTIVSGGSTGVISVPGVGSVYEVTEKQRDILEPAGFNIIKLKNGTLQILSSYSAKQTVKSALSNFENTLLLLYTAREMQLILNRAIDEIPKRNTAEKRAKVKLQADGVCDTLVANQAIERYSNICDTGNNDAEVRNAGILVLDTELYIAGGIKIAVHRTTARGATDEA